MNFPALIILLLFSLTGCARLGYLAEQGIHQAKIQLRAIDNQKLLDDPDVAEDVKRKILLIGEYKKFFYHYFNAEPTSIYTKTTMLENEAVSYLVIASPHTKIEAHEFEFPFVGSFPYIGFGKKDSAEDFAKELQEDKNLVTWIRPVYAYSTLGYLEDRILSSFFHYTDIELAELIFHELFHTIFFIKDEVDLNENLANLYGKELLKEYFKDRPELNEYIASRVKRENLSKRMVKNIGILQDEFSKLGAFLTNEKADELTQRFIEEVFKPDALATCQRLEIPENDCKMKDNWNQASFAAFLTYEEEQDFLEKLQTVQELNLKDYLSWLRMEYKLFQKQKKVESFTEHLKMKVTHAPVAID
jgi:predicted aminopeptidase